MAGDPTSPPVDEHALASGTTVRFVQAMVVMAAATAGLAAATTLPAPGNWLLCALAAGLDPENVNHVAISRAYAGQNPALEACLAHQAPEQGRHWLVLGALTWFALTSWAIFRLLPTLKIRRTRLRPLRDEQALDRLDGLAGEAGLRAAPEYYIAPDKYTPNAVTFGRDSRPKIRLNQGLLWCVELEPERFRAVMLHEFAHVKARDVTLTQATPAMWWAFLAAIVVPWAALELWSLPSRLTSVISAVELQFTVRGIAVAAMAVALVHFARQEVLRSRELHADRTAARLRADLRDLPYSAPEEHGRRRWTRPLAALLRAHPSYAQRRRALGDGAALFAVRAPLVVMTGLGAVVIGGQFLEALGAFALPGQVRGALPGLVVAGLVTGVVGVALWRAVAYAALTGTAMPSGARVGMWLGAGLVLGEAVDGRASEFQWLAQRPEMLAIVFGTGLLFGWWTAASARLWIGAWRGRRIGVPMALVLIGAGLALAAALIWWQQLGLLWSNGFRLDPESTIAALVPSDEYDLVRSDPLVWWVVGHVLPALVNFNATHLMAAAAAALWVVPLAAWTVRPGSGRAHWLRRSSGGRVAGQGPPPILPLLVAGTVGAVVAWAAMIGGTAYLSTWSGQAGTPTAASLSVAVTFAGAAAVAGSATAAALAVRASGGHRLVAALIASALALPGAMAGIAGVLAADGCVEALTVFAPRCGAVSADVMIQVAGPFALPVIAFSGAAAMAVAAVAAATSRIRTRARRPPRPVRPARPVTDRARLVAAGLCAAGIGFAAVAEAEEVRHTAVLHAEDSGDDAVLRFLPEQAAPTDLALSAQVFAWWEVGGVDLFERLQSTFERLAPYTAGEADQAIADAEAVREDCDELAAIVADAEAYFRVPSPEAQTLWADALEALERAAVFCDHALHQGNRALAERAWFELVEGVELVIAALQRVEQAMAAAELSPE